MHITLLLFLGNNVIRVINNTFTTAGGGAAKSCLMTPVLCYTINNCNVHVRRLRRQVVLICYFTLTSVRFLVEKLE